MRNCRRSRPRCSPLVAFIDIRKAYDVVCREGLLWKLRQHGVASCEWRAVASLLGPSAARARLPTGQSPAWACRHGVRQGSVRSPLLFLVFIDDLAQELLRIPGLTVHGLAVTSLLYADDFALLAETPAALQAGLNAASAWAAKWRVTFGVGPTKSAVDCFSRSRAARGESLFIWAADDCRGSKSTGTWESC